MPPNQRLADATRNAGLSPEQLAESVGVDPKTAKRWLDGTIEAPHRSTREQIAARVQVPVAVLWPELPGSMDGTAELVGAYVTRAQLSPTTVRSLIDGSREHIDVLAYAALWLWDSVPRFAESLAAKAADGVEVRMCLGDPTSAAVELRGEEEGIGEGLAARTRLAASYAAPLARIDRGALRVSGATLYASVVRADDEVLWNVHLFGNAASESPVFHLRRRGDQGIYENVVRSFERVWEQAQPIDLG